MKFSKAQPVEEIAKLVGATLLGNSKQFALGLNEIHRVETGDIAFVDHPKYYQKVIESAATVILIDKETDFPPEKTLLVCESPTQAFNLLGRHFNPPRGFYLNKDEAVVGKNSWIADNVKIGEGSRIGDNCNIYPGVVIYPGSKIGNNVTIHANCTIGASAFYYKRKDGKHLPFYSCGDVKVEDDVEIGANCTIDRGVSATTLIKKGSRLDNMVHIGHDTILGENCLIAGQSAVAGCVTVGNNVTIWGQVAIISGIEIGDGVEILAKSGVGKSCEAGKRYFGSPAEEARSKMQEMAKIKRLIQQ
ncbi:MAG: UDP-3-O-(3-hydroxymyristoyl)glucosamine N-acyltransferase [Luteibaculum sp.]